MRTILRFGVSALALAFLWLFIAAILAVQFWPSVPQTSKGWIAFIAIGPPLYVLGEAFSEWLWSTRPARALAAHPSSGLRILIGVVFGAIVAVGGAMISMHFGWR